MDPWLNQMDSEDCLDCAGVLTDLNLLCTRVRRYIFSHFGSYIMTKKLITIHFIWMHLVQLLIITAYFMPLLYLQ